MNLSARKTIQSLYLLIAAIVVGYGTYLGLTQEGYLDLASLKYFTNQSNLLMALGYLFMIALLFKRSSAKDAVADYVSTTILLAISVTGIVYNLVLVPFAGNEIFFSDYINFSTHFLSSILALGYYFFLQEKGRLSFKHVFVAMAYPILYWLVFVIFGSAINFYPYFFMNPVETGWPMVFVWFVILLAVFVVLGALFVAYDKWQGSKTTDSTPAGPQ